ncbi:MAG: FAD:protein FMN transferase [Pseudomonadota bacterium]|nr:FAD:protein FMN transferase [Pseudomonadota bacterium]
MARVLVPLDIDPAPPRAGSVVRDAAGLSMGTSWSARVVLEAPFVNLQASLQAELDKVVAQMSHWEPASDLGRFNRAPAGSWHTLPPEFATVIAYALQVAQDSGGAYDPCAGALVNLWGFGPEDRFDQPGFQAPSPDAIAAVLATRRAVQFDADASRLFQPAGVQLDLSSVAKGFAVDQMARCLRMQGVRHFLVEAGGELRGAGVKPDGQPWWVALEGVPDVKSLESTVAALHGLAMATSGDYRRYFSYQRQRASHTLDPRSGFPITNDVASVTVLHPSCMAADALSTAMSVLGGEAGLAFAEQRGLAARFLLRHPGALAEVTTSAYRAMLQ